MQTSHFYCLNSTFVNKTIIYTAESAITATFYCEGGKMIVITTNHLIYLGLTTSVCSAIFGAANLYLNYKKYNYTKNHPPV